jgi:hypothetical protein
MIAELRREKSQKNKIDLFMYASLGSGIGDIAQLVEHHPCNWLVALTGWMLNCLGKNDNIFYLNRWLTFFQEWGRTLEHAIDGSPNRLMLKK